MAALRQCQDGVGKMATAQAEPTRVQVPLTATSRSRLSPWPNRRAVVNNGH
jgi:hypothetical protein